MAKKVSIQAPRALYKVLRDGKSIYGGGLVWSLPDGDRPGDWHSVEGPLVRCKNGLHLTRFPADRWSHGCEVYLVEAEDLMFGNPEDEEVVARRVRLLRRLTWAELAEFGITAKGVDRDHPSQKKKAKSKYGAPPPPPPAGPSPTMALIETVWENRCCATPHAWIRVNQAMYAALMLAIEGGLAFNKDDFKDIERKTRGGRWMGEPERFFKVAVEEGHVQACVSFESWVGRPPFMWDGKRLFVGRSFPWEGYQVTVTSFHADGTGLTACAYRPKESRGDYLTKVEKRFNVSLAALKRAEQDRKVELSIRADSTGAQEHLKEAGLFMSVEELIALTPEQRVEAVEWASAAANDRNKERVKPPPAPRFLEGAIAKQEAEKANEKLSEAQSDLRSKRASLKYSRAEVARYEREIAALEKVCGETDPVDVG